MSNQSFVYFVQSFGGGPIKIGLSKNPTDRVEHLMSGSPVQLDIVAVVQGGRTLERGFHLLFAPGRLHGEWFDESTPGLAEAIEAIVNDERGLLPAGMLDELLLATDEFGTPDDMAATSIRPEETA